MLLTTYVNESGRRTLRAGPEALPGGIIVEENYMPGHQSAPSGYVYTPVGG